MSAGMRRAPPIFVDDQHQRDHDALIEKRCQARMWLRAQGRLQRDRAPVVPEFLAQHFPSARLLRAV